MSEVRCLQEKTTLKKKRENEKERSKYRTIYIFSVLRELPDDASLYHVFPMHRNSSLIPHQLNLDLIARKGSLSANISHLGPSTYGPEVDEKSMCMISNGSCRAALRQGQLLRLRRHRAQDDAGLELSKLFRDEAEAVREWLTVF